MNPSKDRFQFLAIGNSLTKHGVCDYWWNPVGMAATDEYHDYFHLVLKELKNRYPAVTGEAFNFAIWEITAENRGGTLPALDELLDRRPDFITVQLGENANDLTDFETDFIQLLRYVSEKVPGAKIAVIGDFWENGDRDRMKERAANLARVSYLPLGSIKDNPAYQCGMHTVVRDPQGNLHTVEHEGVAAHPGNIGMQAIADIILREI